MGGPATQQQEGQRQGRTDAANQQIVIPEALQVDVRQYRASRQRRLVCRQVGHPERVHNAGNNQRAVDTGEPENLAHQNREQNRRQRVGGGNQRLQQMHDRLRQDHPGLRFDKQIQRMQSRNNHQHRDQDFKRTGDAGGDLFRQTNRNVVLLQPRVNAGGVDGGDQRGENALTGQILSGNFAIGIGCGDQQESHKRQQTGHHRIELKLTTEAGANAD
ncbi:Uncharacterised protein [Klebsiella pneumoniae]|nr:Uncharacterised protein [Klebsiella pneumoniae]